MKINEIKKVYMLYLRTKQGDEKLIGFYMLLQMAKEE